MPPVDASHVFVVQADLTKLACDYYLIPTDASYHVREDRGDATHARYQRARPLLGMPVFGTGAGGFDNVRGQVLDMILELTHDVVESASFDIAIVCSDRSDYAALQARPKRLELSSDSLRGQQMEIADELGAMARVGRLVLFLGAGISIPAGLPSWKKLLEDLAAKSTEWQGRVSELLTKPLPAAASELERSIGKDAFHQLLSEQLQRGEYALGHALVASLRVKEVITTNFDDLYEQAAAVTFRERPLRTLPWERAEPDLPWLLKMHGGIGRGHVIFSSEDYETYDEVWRPLVSIVQALLITRHMLFVGYSLTDSNSSFWPRKSGSCSSNKASRRQLSNQTSARS